MNFDNDEEALESINRLLEQLHRAGHANQGGIVINIYEKGSQHVDHVDNQYFYGDACPKSPKEKEMIQSRKVAADSLTECIRYCITLLMAERIGDEPLFNLQSHWQAVYRILVDKGYCRDSDFNGFDAFIRTVMPEKVSKPYRKDSVKQISQTDFNKPFNKWRYDLSVSRSHRTYERMVAVASRFKAILEENGL